MKAAATSTTSNMSTENARGLLLAVLCALATGCTQVDGGAVELSWKLRPASSSLPDKFVNCNSGQDGTSPVTRIRLDWEVVGRSSGFASWRCDDNHGVTGFDLPEGRGLAVRHTRVCGSARHRQHLHRARSRAASRDPG